MAKEQNAYILGTEAAELQRLGLQHQVWAGEAHSAWYTAGFTEGQTILDLGCGPGFCSTSLGYIVGPNGKVIAVDKSKYFIEFLNRVSTLYQLPIETQCVDFNDMHLVDNSLDGVYSRWALAWVPNVEQILIKLKSALKPGGKLVFHEYYDWSLLQSAPELPNLKKAIAAALKTFYDSDSLVDIGKFLPEMCTKLGMTVVKQRPMNKLATPDKIEWQWPRTFFHIYFPKLVEAGYLSKDELQAALKELEELRHMPYATILTPQMVELIVQK